MKFFYIGLLILCLLLCACYFSTHEVRSRTQAMLLPLRSALQAEDPANRARALAEAEASWKKASPVLDALISHERTFEVSSGLEDLRLAGPEEFDRLCSGLITKLERIAGMDLPRLSNIL